MDDIYVTNNFKWEEFLVSSQYPDLAKQIILTETDRVKIWFLTSMLLQPLRDDLGHRILITSGKRSAGLNNSVGGSPTSDHLFKNTSCAGDFRVLDGQGKVSYALTEKAVHWIRFVHKTGFGQLIWYPKKPQIHVSLPTPKHCGDFRIVS